MARWAITLDCCSMFVQQRLILIGCKVVARSLHHTHRKLYTQSLWISRFVYLKACISISSSVFANPKQLTKCWLLFVMYLLLKMFWLHTGLYVDDFDWYSNRSAASACQFWKKSLVEMTPMFPTRLQKNNFHPTSVVFTLNVYCCLKVCRLDLCYLSGRFK